MVEEYAAVDESTILPIVGPSTGTRDVLTDPRLAAVEAELLDTLRA